MLPSAITLAMLSSAMRWEYMICSASEYVFRKNGEGGTNSMALLGEAIEIEASIGETTMVLAMVVPNNNLFVACLIKSDRSNSAPPLPWPWLDNAANGFRRRLLE